MQAISNRVVIGDLDNPILEFDNAEIRRVETQSAVSLVGKELFIDQFLSNIEYEVFIPYIIRPHKRAIKFVPYGSSGLVTADNKRFVVGSRAKKFVPYGSRGLVMAGNKRFIVGKRTVDYSTLGIKASNGQIICSMRNYNLRLLPFGTKITFFSGGNVVGEYFCKNVERVGKCLYKLTATSAIGLASRQYHKGGIYTGQLFPDVLRDILGDGYEFTVDGLVAAERVYGWLPYATRRENLHQLILAHGVTIAHTEAGKMYFTFLDDSESGVIDESMEFTGGSVKYNEPASRIEVTEHGYHYLSDVEEEILFDNTNSDVVYNAMVTFDHPVYANSIYAESSTIRIHQAGTNYVVVSGIGIIKGKPYIHTTRIIAKENPAAANERVVKVENATLVTLMTSEYTALRLSEYYFHATSINQDIEVKNEKPGKRYMLKNSYGELFTGFLTKMDAFTSSFRRGKCEFISGYTPIGQGSTYSQRVLFPIPPNSNEEWQIPSFVYNKTLPTIRIVLIGKGFPGEKGENGEDGEPTQTSRRGKGGAGGAGGKGGKGGRVFATTIYVGGQTKIKFENVHGETVMHSESYTFSSADGASYDAGYYDPFGDATYALPGHDGAAGGAGGVGSVETHAKHGEPPEPGEDVEYGGVVYKGGAPGETYHKNGADFGIHPNLTVYFSGAGGAGAAVGSDGDDVTDELYTCNAVPGANGANGAPPDQIYGNGGNGGHGGGGGGGAGYIDSYNHVYSAVIGEASGEPGTGGAGGNGSDGYYGCALIYY